MLYYFLQVNIYWALFYMLYATLLSNETFFRLNRAYLLLGLTLGALLPLVPLEVSQGHVATVYLKTFVVTTQRIHVASEGVRYNLQTLLLGLYVFGAFGMTMKFLFDLSTIRRMVRFGRVERLSDVVLIHSDRIRLPFSFMRWVFLNEVSLEADAREKIIRHEVSHVKQGHSFDVLFLSVLQVAFWCSPLIYCYRKSLRNVHEYLADEAVLETASVVQYGRLLLQQSQSGGQVALANHFIHSLIKKRIFMMTKKRSRQVSVVKYAMVAPLVGLLMVAFAKPIKALPERLSLANMDAGVSEVVLSTVSHSVLTVQKGGLRQVVEKIAPISSVAPASSRSLISDVYLGAVEPKEMEGDTDKPFGFVDKMPEFSGGMSAMFKYLGANMKYPKIAKDRGCEGMVYVNFTVQKDGSLSTFVIKMAKGTITDTVLVGTGTKEAKTVIVKNELNGAKAEDNEVINSFSGEAIRVISSMPKWIAGSDKGKEVAVSYTLPIRFKLE